MRVDGVPTETPKPHSRPRSQPFLARLGQGTLAFLESETLAKSFIMFGFAVAAVLVLAFGMDLAFGWPFQRASLLFDSLCFVGGATLAYLSWNTLRDTR